jgi:hypothetical protein
MHFILGVEGVQHGGYGGYGWYPESGFAAFLFYIIKLKYVLDV